MISETTIQIDREILSLINKSKIGTVCCCENNTPYCFNIFYSVLEKKGCIVFKSSADTKHAMMMEKNHLVAGTIIPDKTSLANSSGVQFEGRIVDNKELQTKAALSYYSRYPFAGVIKGKLWIIEFQTIKYTSTVNGIKHKLSWTRS